MRPVGSAGASCPDEVEALIATKPLPQQLAVDPVAAAFLLSQGAGVRWLKVGALAVASVALLVVAVTQWTGGRRRLFWVEVFIALLAGVAVGIVLADGWG